MSSPKCKFFAGLACFWTS